MPDDEPERHELYRRLAAGDAAAAAELLRHPEWLTGDPPSELLVALSAGPEPPAEALVDLARAWPRGSISAAALAALLASTSPTMRERLAWLLKQVLASRDRALAMRIVLDPQQPPEVRRWIAEGLDRLASAGEVGWDDLAPVVDALAQAELATLRDALVGLLMSLPWQERSADLLIELLHDSDPFVVAGAIHALSRHREAVARIDPRLIAALRDHRNPVVRQSAAELG